MMSELFERLKVIARTPILMIASEYDGTLSDCVADPSLARANPRALEALDRCISMPWTYGAIISGRSLEDLHARLGELRPHFIAGSHGAEIADVALVLSERQAESLARLEHIVDNIARRVHGVRVERKPASVALHYREASMSDGSAAVEAAISECTPLHEVHIRHGSMVVEFMVMPASEGESLHLARHRCGATGVIYIGDDVTDADAFGALLPHDLSVNVGDGQTIASHRVASVTDVAELLESLAALRADWVGGRNLVSLAQCGLLSDQRTTAIVSLGARISWLCLPRTDSSAIFSELVGGPPAGYFEIAPLEPSSAPRCAFDGDSFVLVTEWAGLRISDYLDASGGRAYQKAGRADLIRVIEGTLPARLCFAPRLDFGRIATRLKQRENGIEIDGSNDPITLRAPGVTWSIQSDGVHHTAVATVDPSTGPIVLELRYGTASLAVSTEPEPERREQNRRFWSGWSRSLTLPPLHPALVKRSALVIKALCHGPNGGIAAAATTSLPELIGGTRNWDYRYCWPRDAAMAAASLVRLGNTGHALKLLDWILEVVDRCESPDRLRPIYTISGSHLPPEADLGHLTGYADSRPVRIGNAASNQVQLDVFAPIVHLVALLAERGAPIAPDHWRLVRAMVRAVEARWSEPDHGIWEMRLERRHYVHSKAMCWHTINRALVVEEAILGTRNNEWSTLADTIRGEVLCRGWNPTLGAFVGAYELPYPDAAVLTLGLCGLIPRDDARWIATVGFVERELRDGPTVRRYKTDDGLPGGEGGMHICTGWLIESLASIGRCDDARDLLDQFATLMTGPCLLTEQYDPVTKSAVGNIAQAYSHLAFINASLAIADCCANHSPSGAVV
ncbi:MAG: trehalose-phosphatase [Phycisphaerales bacterium]|nr:trehalose-phosphatase [Phycisphaerales bacterium]